jgi:deoxyribonuclease IV
MFYFGSHISVAKGLLNEAKKVRKSKGNLLQIFLTAKKHRKVSKKAEPELIEFKKYLEKHKMKVFVHSSYLVNLAKDWDKHSWWLKNLELEIEYAGKINAVGIVVHFGHKLQLSKTEAYNNMYSSILYILSKTKNSNVKILLETSAGQGTEMCYRLDDLAYFYNKIKIGKLTDRVKLCIDTCHIFSAGYDIRTKEKIKMYLEEFEELIGVRYITLIHLNDSKSEIGSRLDRHQNIGKGYIGLKGLKLIFKYFKSINKYIILETPNDGYLKEIQLLNS